MITYNDLYKIPKKAKGCTVLIGNFDGVHKGHQALINKGKEIAKANGTKLAVVTFSPHPRKFFQQDPYNFYLTELPMKLRLIEEAGVDYLFVIDFNRETARLTPNNFINLLSEDLGIKHLIVGENFCFGAKRAGNIKTLQRAANKNKFNLTVLDLIKYNDKEKISSSEIRRLLQKGDFKKANELLGWQWHIESEVVVGDKRGRLLGYPTANQKINEHIRFPYGVYVTKVQIENENQWRDGISNFGIRPMFRAKIPLLETHIFNFKEEIYGKTMKVVPLESIRGEKLFSSKKDLVDAIEEDCIKAKAMLKSA